MTLRDFKIGWRLLIQQPAYSAVVILGLSTGFAACFLLLSYVRYSLDYDSNVPNAERVYLMECRFNLAVSAGQWLEMIPYPFLDVARHSDLVESITPVGLPHFGPLPFKANNHLFQIDLLETYPAFQQMFGVQVMEGDLQQALNRPDGLALTQSTANKIFGDTHVVGRLVQIMNKSFVVTAVLADPPANSSITYTALTGFNTGLLWSADDLNHMFNSWADWGGKIYVKLKPGVSPTALTQLLQDASDHSPFVSKLDPALTQQLLGRKLTEVRLVSLSDFYFDQSTAGSTYTGRHGDRRMVFGMAAVAILILFLATINYVNLTAVRALSRQREIALRKILGASVGRLIGQFLAESVLVGLIASGLGIVLAWLLLPLFSGLVDRRLEITSLFLLFALALGIMVGIGAGAYPAWVAVRVRPQATLAGRGTSDNIGGIWLRRVLTVVQFTAAITLTGVTLAIGWQTYFASQVNPGFDPANLLVLEMPQGIANPASRNLYNALTRLPGVTGVAVSKDPVGKKFLGGIGFVESNNGRPISILWRPVSANFFNVLGIGPAAGRMFNPKLDKDDGVYGNGDIPIVLNGAAVRALGFSSPEQAVGKTLTMHGNGGNAIRHVVGVTPEIRLETLHELSRPIVYYPDDSQTVFTIRIGGDMADVENAANRLTQQFMPDYVITIRHEQSYYSENYRDDERLAILLGTASLTAFVIAAFGIYVLATYSVRRLSKQIVLRKLYGADYRDIAGFVGREFIVLIAIGASIGLPVAAVAIQRYLASYVEHAPIGGWTLLAAVLLALLVTFISTLRHTVIAMRLAPAQILRD